MTPPNFYKVYALIDNNKVRLNKIRFIMTNTSESIKETYFN